jgi:hypothetical protein
MASLLGQGGFLAALALLVGAIIRLLKADSLNLFLATLSLPPIPKRALPWLAVVLGFALAALEALLRGAKAPEAIAQGLYGIFSGATAVGGDQTVGKLVEGSKNTQEPTKPKPEEPTASASEQSPEP